MIDVTVDNYGTIIVHLTGLKSVTTNTLCWQEAGELATKLEGAIHDAQEAEQEFASKHQYD